MESKFNENYRKKENLSREYRNSARKCKEENDNQHCEQECRYLQMAADLEYELTQISIGAARDRHERIKNELDIEIMQVRKAISKANAAEKAKMSKPSVSGADDDDDEEKTQKDDSEKSEDELALDRTVRTWYKDAPNHSFADVSGMIQLKKRLQECIEDSRYEDLMDYLKIPHLNSYLFVGPPGCGKTYIIEAFAHELMGNEYKYMSLQGSDIISRYVGDAEKIVSRLFQEAEENAPCIVFIDEIDSICKNRSLPNLPEYAANITTSFLTGFNQINNSDSKVIFISATNYPQRVDSAMLDRVEVIEVPLPDMEARRMDMERQFGKIIHLAEPLSFERMAAETDSYNYRDIKRISTRIKKNIFREITMLYPKQEEAIQALLSGKYPLTEEKWNEVYSKFRPSPKKDILDAIEEWKKRNLPEEEDYDAEDYGYPYDDDEEPIQDGEF